MSKAHVQEEMATSQIILEDMTTLGICSLLEEEGFPDEVIDSFKDEEMDGLAIVIAFGSQSGPDCLQSVVKRCGYRLKVYNFLKSLMVYEFQETASSEVESVTSTPSASVSVTPVSSVASMPSSKSHKSAVKVSTPVSIGKGAIASHEHASTSKLKSVRMNPMFQPPVDRSFVTIPEPFPIPEFREDTQQRLDIGRFTQDDRLYYGTNISLYALCL